MEKKESKKEQIRKRYQGIDQDEIDVIPAIPEDDVFEADKEKRVAVYVRVSTGDPRQTSSYELQKNHYSDVVSRHPNWSLVKIYADEGITGTSLNHRDAFNEMIRDCYDGKIDLIIAKSVSRFARNVMDCVGYVRQLAQLPSPIGIFFEAENIYTLDKDSELILTIISALAQEESHNKSESMNASIEMRFRRGIFLTPPLLGYDLDENGELTINEKEASVVRLIFFMYLYGFTCAQIAKTLTNLACKTKPGNTEWAPGSVLGILRNERYCGDVLARKTWTPNYLDHKSKKNRRNRNQYRTYDHHDAIISRADFIAVQQFIDNAKYGDNRFLPELKVVNQGALSGFVMVHPRWAGFKAKDYFAAVASVQIDEEYEFNPEIELNDGEFDLRNYEIARSQFFNISGKPFMTISNREIMFSDKCIHKFDENQYIDILISPNKRLIAVRPSDKGKKNALRWAKYKDGDIVPRKISGVAFLGTIYEILGWNLVWNYRIQGTYYSRDDLPVLIFDMSDAEVIMRESDSDQQPVNKENSLSTTGKSVIAYPTEWIHDFGYNFYTHAQVKELEGYAKTGKWDTDSEGIGYKDSAVSEMSDKNEIKENITNAIDEIEKRKNDE